MFIQRIFTRQYKGGIESIVEARGLPIYNKILLDMSKI
jgi:hypothetical protein